MSCRAKCVSVGKVNEYDTILLVKKPDRPANLIALSSRFAKEEDGMITIFACFMILMMLMVGGIGVDMMRHEMERTRLQAVSDRAVLAAADLDQTLNPKRWSVIISPNPAWPTMCRRVTVEEGSELPHCDGGCDHHDQNPVHGYAGRWNLNCSGTGQGRGKSRQGRNLHGARHLRLDGIEQQDRQPA